MDSMRVLVVGVVLSSLLMNACSAEQSVADYAEEVEALVVTMNARLDELDADLDQSWDLDHIHTYAEQRVAARSALIDGLGALEPPDEVAELHETALEILKRVTAAETAMADRVMTWTSESDVQPIWETPEGIAARTADADAIAICLAAQAEFDQTADRAEFENAPWIPAEMKEVILVAFGCEVDDR
jgi:outer membrane murein-binding lipoprotein Lpp